MCTVSWLRTADGYELFCNRDEKRTRRPALAPRVHRFGGVRFAAPVDADGGGSWVGVNEHRLALCLLNGHEAEAVEPREEAISRGLLLCGLMDCASPSHVAERVKAMKLASFRPFTLVALAPATGTVVFRWTGHELSVALGDDVPMPLASSSFDAAGVAAFRRRQFERMRVEAGEVTADLLLAFHSSHEPSPGAYSACMHREDAETVSFSRVKVTGGAVEFSYSPQPPCRGGATSNLRLEI
jgi:hypothetical protein